MTRFPRLLLTLLPALLVAGTLGTAVPSHADPAPSSSPSPSTSSLSSERTATTSGLEPFVREWFGHTRVLRIDEAGRVRERASSGCCDLRLDLSLRVTGASGTVRDGTVRVRVTRVRVYKSGLGADHPRPERGDTAVLRVRRGVLTDRLTGITYCNPAASRRGVCGA